MNEFSSLFILLAISAVAYGQDCNSGTNNYINISKQKFNETLQDMDNQMEIIREDFQQAKSSILINQNMLVDSIARANEKLNFLETLGTSTKNCISKYRKNISTEKDARSAINRCTVIASNKHAELLCSASRTKTKLNEYYDNSFYAEIRKCESISPQNRTVCFRTVVTAADNRTIISKTEFSQQIETARCSSNAYTKELFICSYAIEKDVLHFIAEVNTLIQRCLSGNEACIQCPKNNCPQCSQGIQCSEIYEMPSSQISYEKRDMSNLFYGKNGKNCVMINII